MTIIITMKINNKSIYMKCKIDMKDMLLISLAMNYLSNKQ